jgi:catalase-peroxidase
MAMNDEETVALIAGGHTLGKAHGAHKASDCVGPEPEAAELEEQGLGWKNRCGTGKGVDTVTSGLEGAWTGTPVQWSHGFLGNLFKYDWELVTGPGGAKQWQPKGVEASVPDAHDPDKLNKPMMLTTDLALKFDPKYKVIAERFYKDPKAFEDAFARAWYKLTHRDMGPYARLVGAEVPPPQAWQDPVPAVDHKLVGEKDIAALKRQILESGLTVPELVRTAWASASSYRDTDMRGGANGARIRLAPQKDWEVNQPAEIGKVLAALEGIQKDFNGSAKGGKKISMADLIVLGGAAAIEKAAKDGGHAVKVPFAPGRSDATQEMTDVSSFNNLATKADGFRNWAGDTSKRTAPEQLIDKADFLSLTAPEMAVLVGGMRVMGATHGGSKLGVFTESPGQLTNDFFVNLLDMNVEWKKVEGQDLYEGRMRGSDTVKWTGTSVDVVFGSNSQLRALAEVYAGDDSKDRFVKDFVAAWTKVMRLDRFDLKNKR